MTSSLASSRRLSFSARFFSRAKSASRFGTGKVEDFFHVDHLIHDLRLADIARNAVEHENVDIGFKFVCIDRGIDPRLPELDRDFIGHEFAFARVFEKSAADLGARIDRAKDIAAGAMKEARDGAERAALSAFAAAGRAEKEIGGVFHCGYLVIAESRGRAQCGMRRVRESREGA